MSDRPLQDVSSQVFGGVVNGQASEDVVVTMKMKLNSEAESADEWGFNRRQAETWARISRDNVGRSGLCRSCFLFRFEKKGSDESR